MIIQMLLFWLLANSLRVTGFLVYFWYLRVKTLDSFSVFFSFTPQMGLVSVAFVAEYCILLLFWCWVCSWGWLWLPRGTFCRLHFYFTRDAKVFWLNKTRKNVFREGNVNWVSYSAKSNSSTSESFKIMLSWKLNAALSFALCSFFFCQSIYKW